MAGGAAPAREGNGAAAPKARPRGRYLAHEVARLAGVSGNTVGQWARRGYIRSSQSSREPLVYSYEDIAEALVVHELLDRGVPHGAIRQAIAALRARHGGDWPLTDAQLATVPSRDGRPERSRVVAELSGAVYDIGELGWQQIGGEHLERIVGPLERGGWAARELGNLRHVEVHPDRLSGRPTLRGRRLAAQDVAELAVGCDGVELLRQDYGVSDDEIEDARRWWTTVQELEAAA